MPFAAIVRCIAAAVVSMLIASCGGSGDGGGVNCNGSPYSVTADSAVAVGKAAGAAVAGCPGTVSEIVWTQTGGAAVTLMSAKSQAISFEPPAAGTYTFSVVFRDGQGTSRTASVSVNATAAPSTSFVTVRSDHAVRKGANVSLRAWPTLAGGDTVASLTWSQVAGPAVTLDTSDPNRILFVAPDVTQDTVLRFRVTLQTTAGTTDSDDAIVLVENAAQAPSANQYVFGGDHVSRVYPYRPMSQYAGVLANCVYGAQLQWTGGGKNTCSLNTLPFLHQTTGGNLPTVQQVMDRVLVSHDWMGQAFEDFLNAHDANGDFRRLLNGVTAVVIGSHVRPSFYYALTGAIYLDADNFWRTPAERDTINEAPDFRSDFGRDLNYAGLWRYTLNNQSIFVGFPRTSRISRDTGYLLYEAGWLLYHELGHASDFLEPSIRASLNPTLTAWDNIGPRWSGGQLPSDALAGQYGLGSQELFALAQVKFFGATATPTQIAYTPSQVAAFFNADRATDEYNYASTREDFTMLFEEFMQAYRHGIRRDYAFTDKITSTSTGDNLIVRWGQRGRVAEAAVKPRVKLVLQRLAPWIDPNQVDALPAPLAMRAGESWNANLVLPAPPPAPVRAQSVRGPIDAEVDALLLRRATERHGDGGTRKLPPR